MLLLRYVSIASGLLLLQACGGTPENPPGGSSNNAGAGGVVTNTGGQGGAVTGAGGSVSTGGVTGTGGSAGSLGTGGVSSGGASAGGSGGVATGGTAGTSSGAWGNVTCKTWPAATGEEQVDNTIDVSGTYDGQLKRYISDGLGDGSQEEGQSPLFVVANGGTLKNVIIGAPAADGIHCEGSCTLQNVWWEDVGEDAATFEGSSSSTVVTIDCGGAKHAADKTFQHNGGGTVTIKNFSVEDAGKLYRSCGDCSDMYERHAVLENISAKSVDRLAGVNIDYDDSATFNNLLIDAGIVICERYDNDVSVGTGADPTYCLYDQSDVHYP